MYDVCLHVQEHTYEFELTWRNAQALDILEICYKIDLAKQLTTIVLWLFCDFFIFSHFVPLNFSLWIKRIDRIHRWYSCSLFIDDNFFFPLWFSAYCVRCSFFSSSESVPFCPIRKPFQPNNCTNTDWMNRFVFETVVNMCIAQFINNKKKNDATSGQCDCASSCNHFSSFDSRFCFFSFIFLLLSFEAQFIR